MRGKEGKRKERRGLKARSVTEITRCNFLGDTLQTLDEERVIRNIFVTTSCKEQRRDGEIKSEKGKNDDREA